MGFWVFMLSWLKPYTKTKLRPKSMPCIFLGYSTSHNAYKCYDPNKKYLHL